VLVALETKTWVDAKGREQSRAGFAKVVLAQETKAHAQQLIDTGVRRGAMVNPDGRFSFRNVTGVDGDYQVVDGDGDECAQWLPWVHKFISNAKAGLNGTHHGVKHIHVGRYLGECTCRFNRRHDVPRLFHRAIVACLLADVVS